jgi:hypothetical protein
MYTYIYIFSSLCNNSMTIVNVCFFLTITLILIKLLIVILLLLLLYIKCLVLYFVRVSLSLFLLFYWWSLSKWPLDYCVYTIYDHYYHIIIIIIIIIIITIILGNVVGRYSDWLRAGRPMVWSSSPSRVKSINFSISYRPELGST